MSIALALGGGGALGWAHVGVLHVLEREGVRVAGVSGCSMGAVVAVAYAAGKLARLDAIARECRRLTVARHFDPGLGRGGLIGGRGVRRTLMRELAPLRLEALAIPAALVATDALTGEGVTLKDGPALDAVLASIAVPGVLPPVTIDGRLLIDGGVVDPVPVAAARALGCGPVVAVNVLGDAVRQGRRMQAPRVSGAALAAQGLALMLDRLVRLSLAADAPDMLIEPQAGAFSPWDFSRAADLIAVGEAAATTALPRLRALAVVPAP